MSPVEITTLRDRRLLLSRRNAVALLMAGAACPFAMGGAQARSLDLPHKTVPSLACHAPSNVALYLPMLEQHAPGATWQAV